MPETFIHRTRKVANITEEFQCECGWPVDVGDVAHVLESFDGDEVGAYCSPGCRGRARQRMRDQEAAERRSDLPYIGRGR